ncbi:hypothetical protein BJX62DRAFT_165161 [Aspergillus germanicus]
MICFRSGLNWPDLARPPQGYPLVPRTQVANLRPRNGVLSSQTSVDTPPKLQNRDLSKLSVVEKIVEFNSRQWLQEFESRLQSPDKALLQPSYSNHRLFQTDPHILPQPLSTLHIAIGRLII